MPNIKFPKTSKGVLAYCAANVALGFAEYFNLEWLKWISVVMSIFTSLLLVIILIKYTCNYCKNKKL